MPLIAVAGEKEIPYSFRVEWGLLTPDTARMLHPPVVMEKRIPIAVLWLQPKVGYHTYAHQAGADAMPTKVSLSGNEAAQIRYVAGQSRPDAFDPEMTVNVYEGQTPVFILFPAEPQAGELRVSMLACSDLHCFPVDATLALPVPGNNIPVLSGPDAAPWFTALIQSVASEAGRGAGSLVTPNAAPGTLNGNQNGTYDGDEATVVSAAWSLSPRPFQASLEVSGLGKAILFGLLAGLILNFMPCVLPVITLKISALLAAGGEIQERQRRFREHNLLFSAGILTWFGALAVLFSLADMAWGQLFQNSAVVFGMVLLVFCLGLSMFDVFHLPVLDLHMGGNTRNPRVQAYSTGVLATLLATPCSGPLLGGVLGWSLLQSLPVLLAVFLATGLGMSLPYLAMAWKPAFASRLPRPGAWMQVFERILGFFLMGTALYLLSILPDDMVIPSLIVLLVAAMEAWIWGKWGSLRGTTLRRAFLGGGGLVVLAFTLYVCFVPAQGAVIWQPFRPDEFQAMLGQKAMLVEFTADWCPTCKVLEKTALTPARLAPLSRRYDLTLVRVDMTHHDPQAQALLRELDSASIPVLAIFPAGKMAREPVVLRDLYTAGQMRDAAQSALGPGTP